MCQKNNWHTLHITMMCKIMKIFFSIIVCDITFIMSDVKIYKFQNQLLQMVLFKCLVTIVKEILEWGQFLYDKANILVQNNIRKV